MGCDGLRWAAANSDPFRGIPASVRDFPVADAMKRESIRSVRASLLDER